MPHECSSLFHTWYSATLEPSGSDLRRALLDRLPCDGLGQCHRQGRCLSFDQNGSSSGGSIAQLDSNDGVAAAAAMPVVAGVQQED